MNYIKLYLVNENNQVLSLNKNEVLVPNAPIYKETPISYQVNALSQKVVKLGPSWIRYKLLDVTHHDDYLDVIYGGLIPAQSPIIECYWLSLDNPNYYREIVKNYA